MQKKRLRNDLDMQRNDFVAKRLVSQPRAFSKRCLVISLQSYSKLWSIIPCSINELGQNISIAILRVQMGNEVS